MISLGRGYSKHEVAGGVCTVIPRFAGYLADAMGVPDHSSTFQQDVAIGTPAVSSKSGGSTHRSKRFGATFHSVIPFRAAKEVVSSQILERMGFRIGSAAVVLLTLHVATRYFGSANWGVFVAAMALVTLMVAVEDFGLETVLAREISTHPDDRRRLFALGLGLRLVLSVFGILVVMLVARIMYGHNQGVFITVVALSPILIADALQSACNSVYQAISRLGRVGLIELVASLAGLAAAGYVSYERLNLTDYALLSSGGTVLAAIAALIMVGDSFGVRGGWTVRGWKKLITIAAPFGTVLLINTTYAQIDTIILSLLRPSAQVGWYGVAMLITQLVVSAPSFIMAGLLPRIALANTRECTRILESASGVLAFLAAPVMISGLLLARPVIGVVAGPNFQGADAPLQILIVGTALIFQNAVYGNTLVAKGKERYLLPIGVIILVSNVILNLILVPFYGPIGSACALVMSEIISMVMTMSLFRRIMGFVPRPQGLAAIAAGSMAMIGVWAILYIIKVGSGHPAVELEIDTPSMITALCLGFLITRALTGKRGVSKLDCG